MAEDGKERCGERGCQQVATRPRAWHQRGVLEAEFLFATCQRGMEAALKYELARDRRRAAFQRPGFVTFKGGAAADVLLDSTFAHTYGVSIGRKRRAEVENPRVIATALGREPHAAH